MIFWHTLVEVNMSTRNSMAALAVVLISGVLLVAACSDAGDDIAGPPIPTLDAAGIGPGIQAVAEGPLNAGCANCVEWSCATGTCGYNTANPPGACCTECDFGQPAVPKPSCDPGGGGGGGTCSEQPGAGEWGEGGDFCTSFSEERPFEDPTNLCWSPHYCPSQFTCCYGGPHDDGPY